jgi:hypothetical protein
MTNPCPNCGVAGPNLNCNLHPMPKFGNMTNPCKEIPLPILDRGQAQDREKELLAEIGRLSLRLRTADLHTHTMEAKILELQAAGIIDQMGRKLPLPGHHKDCLHGQNGWAVCYCEEIDKIDAAGTRGTPKCSKCGDTGRTTILGEGIATPTWCTCLKGRPSPLAESVTKAFQTAAADAVRTTLDRGGTAVGEVQGQWQVVSKTCEHGNTECQKCGVGQPVRDPRQDLKPGDHVRFEIEGIIKERQSAGIFQDEDGDFEPIQYAIKDSINRMTYYVGYHQITKKLGSVE